MAEIFKAMGMELETPGTATTPARFLKAMYDASEGYEGDPKLVTAFPTECRSGPDCRISQIVEGPIPFYSLCEHHSLPFFGHAYVGYIAHDRIIGISKLTRLLRLFARRFTLQEMCIRDRVFIARVRRWVSVDPEVRGYVGRLVVLPGLKVRRDPVLQGVNRASENPLRTSWVASTEHGHKNVRTHHYEQA